MPQLTVEDARTGVKLSPYIGADPQQEPQTPPSQPPAADPATSTATPPVDKGDQLPSDSVTPPPATDDTIVTPPASTTPPPADVTADPKDDQQRDDKGRFIPKSRFDEVNERRKRAEAELARRDAEVAAAGKAKETTYDFDAAEKDYANLLLDGKTDEALAKRREIRVAEQAHFESVADARAAKVSNTATVKEKINEIAADYESRYPVFNPDSEQFSEDVVDDLQALYSGYLNSGKFNSADLAFKAALDKTVQMHGAKPLEQKPTPPPTPAVPARTAQKRVDAIVNQPPLLAKAGSGGPSSGDGQYKVSELSEAELMRLPEATRRNLRGDAL
jgi:hypothetical protein